MNPSRQQPMIPITGQARCNPGIACAGFTLTEMMVTLAIAAILAALAAPSFNGLIDSQRAKSAATDITIALSRARAEALKRSTNMTLSPKSGDWTNGWQMLDPVSSTAIEDHAAANGVVISGPSTVIFQSSGRVSGTATPTFSITVTNNTSATRCVSVDLSGRPKSRAGSC